MKPLAIDLCHGHGGWTNGFLAEGYRVIGFDIHKSPEYRGIHIEGDVRVLATEIKRGSAICQILGCASVIVASPPCEEFSRHQMPWTRARNPPQPDLSIWKACVEIAALLEMPIVIENVRAAQGWMGRAKWHSGSFYLWGDVPALMPKVSHRPKENLSSTKRLERAMIPSDLARWIARCFKPADSADTSSLKSAGVTVAPIATAKDFSEAAA